MYCLDKLVTPNLFCGFSELVFGAFPLKFRLEIFDVRKLLILCDGVGQEEILPTLITLHFCGSYHYHKLLPYLDFQIYESTLIDSSFPCCKPTHDIF